MDVTDEPQRFEAASLVALFGAVLLLVSPFLTWFDPGGSAWSLFELLDLVLVAIALYVGVTATARLLNVGPRGHAPRGIPMSGGVALVAVLATMVEPPPVALDASIGFGAWLALCSSVLIFGAGALDLARVSVTVSLGAREDEPAPPAASQSMPRSSAAPTDAPLSRTPSLLRPSAPPPPPADQVPESD